AMLNYEVDPELLRPFIPAGTHPDTLDGRSLITVVGFLFRRAKLWGIPAIGHQIFPEMNLRCYVRRGDRRGVVFIKELVPRRLIVWMARRFGENFEHVPMNFRVDPDKAIDQVHRLRRAEYRWNLPGKSGNLTAVVGSEGQQFDRREIDYVVHRSWAYTARSAGETYEYYVDHPPWKVWPAAMASLQGDFGSVFSPAFGEVLAGVPSSACLVDGSAVRVYPGRLVSLR
ncbi:MAG: DUF2071 domain-containing protein, partial [Planctomycetales bacterium]